MNYETESFRDILLVAMDEAGVKCKGLEDLLQERGIDNITLKRLSEYKNGVSTPPFEKAKTILEVLDWEVDDDYLIASLSKNRENIKSDQTYLPERNRFLHKQLRIRYRSIMPDEEPEVCERFLSERVKEITGNENDITQYIRVLIAKDLNEFILNKEDIENG